MQAYKVFAISGLCVALSVSAHFVARYAADAAVKLEQQASGGGQAERGNIRPPDGRRPPPPEQQQQIDDFAPPPVKLDSDEKLVPIDPEQRQKSEQAIQYWDISRAASDAVWIIPLAGVFLVLMLCERKRRAQIEQESKKEAPAAQTLPDASGGPDKDGSPASDSSSDNSPKEGERYEPQTHQRNGVRDGEGDSGDGPELPAAGGTPGSLSGILRDLQARS